MTRGAPYTLEYLNAKRRLEGALTNYETLAANEDEPDDPRAPEKRHVERAKRDIRQALLEMRDAIACDCLTSEPQD